MSANNASLLFIHFVEYSNTMNDVISYIQELRCYYINSNEYTRRFILTQFILVNLLPVHPSCNQKKFLHQHQEYFCLLLTL
jgi:hypothetical protein